jgi:hypothetical protein
MATQLSEAGRKIVPGKGSHIISFDEACARTKRYRAAMKNKETVHSEIKGGTFNRDMFDEILANPEVTGIRYYFAMVEASAVDGTPDHGFVPSIVILGVDKDGNDMLPSQTGPAAAIASATGKVFDSGWPCSPHCGKTNDLNTD